MAAETAEKQNSPEYIEQLFFHQVASRTLNNLHRTFSFNSALNGDAP